MRTIVRIHRFRRCLAGDRSLAFAERTRIDSLNIVLRNRDLLIFDDHNHRVIICFIECRDDRVRRELLDRPSL